MSHRGPVPMDVDESGDSALDRPRESEGPREVNPENAPFLESDKDMPTVTPEQSAGSQGLRVVRRRVETSSAVERLPSVAETEPQMKPDSEGGTAVSAP